jgi:hypothetical protein
MPLFESRTKSNVSPSIVINVLDAGLINQASPNDIETQEEDPIAKEMEEKKDKADKRNEFYKNILYNVEEEDRVPFYVAFYGLAGPLFGILLTCFLGLIPAHNVITHPEYFYEEMIYKFCSMPVWASQFILSCIYWMNIKCIKTFRHFAIGIAYLLLFQIFQRLLGYFAWTQLVKFPYPMPFHTTISRFFDVLVAFLVVWRLFEPKWRKDNRFRKRFKYFVLTFLMVFIIHGQYSIWGKLFLTIPSNYQWILALLLPFARELNLWIFVKLAQKASGSQDVSVQISTSYINATRHGVFLSVIIGTSATDLSCWIIFGTDVCINMSLALTIIWIKKRKSNIEEKNINKMIESLIALTLSELVENVVPMTFFVSFLICYYGPNSEMIGNVRSSYFHYVPISDIDRFIENLFQFLGLEFATVLATGIL